MRALDDGEDVPLEGTDFVQELVSQYAHLPHVHLVIVIFVPQLLGTEVARRADEGIPHVLAVHRAPEVANADIVLTYG